MSSPWPRRIRTSQPFRQALILTEYQGLEPEATGRADGYLPIRAKSRVQRARDKLRDMLLRGCHFRIRPLRPHSGLSRALLLLSPGNYIAGLSFPCLQPDTCILQLGWMRSSQHVPFCG